MDGASASWSSRNTNTAGKCRKAESTETKTPRPPRFASFTRKPASAASRFWPKSKDWIHYDLPPESVGIALKGKYRGQRQKWFAMRFTGAEQEIDLQPAGHKPEFDAWRWAPPNEVLELVVDFKRTAYEAVLAEFAHLHAHANAAHSSGVI